MTRDELIEAIADALRNAQLNTFSNQAAIAITAIEAQGLAIVPVKTTDAMCRAGWTAVFGGQQPDPNVNALAVCADAMIQAGKL